MLDVSNDRNERKKKLTNPEIKGKTLKTPN
jgi:hypothetical protein